MCKRTGSILNLAKSFLGNEEQKVGTVVPHQLPPLDLSRLSFGTTRQRRAGLGSRERGAEMRWGWERELLTSFSS